ncbi:hypothetical protein Phi19:2_gp011 [Cellulophaga phage phi19:2]|uniref:Uncharacterized protein n=2 Tax=Cellulophaga phage phiST TaxID=756282 RepID=M4SLC8_9CAUD|nr:hypothetical protein CGPG_00095 [Cellulophaga phage phiST]AGH56793.1 hypothetical protein CGPG_00095 [Cellulophaga phage phiST]AGO47150.1 hypothetical protein PhiST_gp011 [Cellulophaga phage phiST]AGO48646.1 hypothetical protein Phi19:2_gp011 [Cellulophaga phage phi19:2]
MKQFFLNFDINAIFELVDYLDLKYTNQVDYSTTTGRGDDAPNTITIINPTIMQDRQFISLLNESLDLDHEDQDWID